MIRLSIPSVVNHSFNLKFEADPEGIEADAVLTAFLLAEQQILFCKIRQV